MSQTVYATLDDLEIFGVRAEADDFNNLPDEKKQRYLSYASARADSIALGLRYHLPISGWGDDLRAAVCAIAAAKFYTVRGMNAQGASKAIFDAEKDAVAWLTMVGNGHADLCGVTDQTPDDDEGRAYITSDPPRGWGRCARVREDIAEPPGP